MDWQAFNELLVKLQPEDTLIVTKLNRFARSMRDGSDHGKAVH
ncbi:recombinase family protein [Peribacillus sp. SCS-155]